MMLADHGADVTVLKHDINHITLAGYLVLQVLAALARPPAGSPRAPLPNVGGGRYGAGHGRRA